MEQHRGALILVFGILAFFVCPIFGIVAWVMGNGDLQKMAAGAMDPEGEGLTKAGKICGMIATILWIASTVLVVILLALGMLGAGLSSQIPVQ